MSNIVDIYRCLSAQEIVLPTKAAEVIDEMEQTSASVEPKIESEAEKISAAIEEVCKIKSIFHMCIYI